jgi:anti-sigma factor RsiW
MRGAQFHVDHAWTRRRLSAYLDGELAPVERDLIEHHVDECPDCRRTARSLQRVVTGLALLRRCHPSRLAADVIERLVAQTRSDGDSRRR